MPFPAYLAVFSIPLLVTAGLWLGGAWAWAAPAVVYLGIPLVELALPGARRNPSAEEEAARRSTRAFDAVLYATVPVQVALVVALSARAGMLAGWELAGAIVGVGTCCGALGINVGHELGHRADRREQLLARLLLATSLYAHFFVEHNRGHHARVATPDDPASARRGEVLFAFWARSVVGGWRSAWRLDRDEVLVGALVQAGVVGALGAAFGVVGAAAFVGAAAVGALLLETVNYVEHYGLVRARRPDGGWERVGPAHSWTSDRPLSRALLFDLPRHADHHAFAGRPYAVLRHVEAAPELPTGYAGMVVLALVPPLYFAVMDRQLVREHARLATA